MKRAQTEPTVHIADFTKHPGPRYKRQGRGSGQEFRDKYLAPAFEQAVRNDERVLIVLTGTELGAALLRRRLFRLFIGVFARGGSLFGTPCAGTAPPPASFRAASPA